MTPWWEEHESWYEHELKCLDHYGYHYDIKAKPDRNGWLILTIDYQYKEKLIKLEVQFPVNYPLSAPQITALNHSLYRHHGGTLNIMCTLAHDANEDTHWIGWKDTLSGLLNNQVPRVLDYSDKAKSGQSFSEFERKLEAPVGEAQSTFIAGNKDGGFLINDWKIPSSEGHGQFTCAISELHKLKPSITGKDNLFIRGVVTSIVNNKGTKFSQQKGIIVEAEKGKENKYITCKWKRAILPPYILSDLDFWKWFKKENKLSYERLIKKAKKKSISVMAMLLTEEVKQGESGERWLFLTFHYDKYVLYKSVSIGHSMSDDEIYSRTPELLPLQEKSAVLIGLGSIGSPIAIHLARAGIGTLYLIDKDIVTPGNTVRWALGLSAFGKHKAIALKEYINAQYPKCKVVAWPLNVGSVEVTANQQADFENIINKADIVIDASASLELNYYLGTICHNRDKDFVWGSTTEGGYGGIVGRVRPNVIQATHHDYCNLVHKGTIKTPNYKKSDQVVPAGCLTPTFTGAGIDCEQIGLLMSRLAISTMSPTQENSYPDYDWDVAVINLRDTNGNSAILPTSETYTLDSLINVSNKHENLAGK